MRSKGLFLSMALLVAGAAPSLAATFGQVVPIAGHASDIVLDESRSQLYIANFGGGTVQVMSTLDNTIHSSFNIPALPGAMALSLDSQYLVIAHYSNSSIATGGNIVTILHLADNTRITVGISDAPLGVAFVRSGPSATGQALIVTSAGFQLLDPVACQFTVLATFANLSQAVPVLQATFPGQILETAITTSADGYVAWGVGGAGTGNQVIFTYDGHAGALYAFGDVSSPSLLPRVSVSADGSSAMIGWALFSINGYLAGRYPNVLASTNITGHAFDSKNGIIYGQFPDASQPTGPPSVSSTPAGSVPSTKLPAILIMDSDNLTVRERIAVPENMVGRAVLNSAATVLYAISDSGVMVLPVGSLNSYPRLTASTEDVLLQSNFCNRNQVSQSLTITDPGGGHTAFRISPSQAGVTVVPSSGVTPATVTVTADPAAFAGTNGTTPVTLTLSSSNAVNQPRPVRVLISNPDQDQRGTVVDLPGNLTDILPDPARNRFYVLRADKNLLLVFDGASNQQVAALRTATTPSMMAFTLDRKYLMVGHNDSQLITMYDLDALRAVSPVALPGGHYGRSIADTNSATLVMARDEGSGLGAVDQIIWGSPILPTHSIKLPSLGVYKNQVAPTSVLVPTPNGANVMLASPDGNMMLYSSSANSFTVSRKDLTSLSGGVAASNYGTYVVGNNVFNASLVPQGVLNTLNGTATGFAFLDQGGYLLTAANSSGPGIIQNLPQLQSSAVRPVRTVEAPLFPTAPSTTSGSTGATGTGNSTGTGTAGNGSGSTSLYNQASFTRTVAPMPSAGTVIVLTTSGFTVLSANYDAAVAPPSIQSVVNAADGTQPVAPGGLISVFGAQMSPVNMATQQIPLPTALGESCLSINGAPVPLLFVSGGQINAQLPFNVTGGATLTIHSPGGISDNYLFTVQPTAPSVFLSGSAGPMTGLATVVRADNNQLITPTNPVHPKDTLVIYLTGLGATVPAVGAGLPAPSSPLASAATTPAVTLGGQSLNVSYAGLVPGEVGVYQINATVPMGVPLGMSIPLTINQGGPATSVNLRVVN